MVLGLSVTKANNSNDNNSSTDTNDDTNDDNPTSHEPIQPEDEIMKRSGPRHTFRRPLDLDGLGVLSGSMITITSTITATFVISRSSSSSIITITTITRHPLDLDGLGVLSSGKSSERLAEGARPPRRQTFIRNESSEKEVGLNSDSNPLILDRLPRHTLELDGLGVLSGMVIIITITITISITCIISRSSIIIITITTITITRHPLDLAGLGVLSGHHSRRYDLTTTFVIVISIVVIIIVITYNIDKYRNIQMLLWHTSTMIPLTLTAVCITRLIKCNIIIILLIVMYYISVLMY